VLPRNRPSSAWCVRRSGKGKLKVKMVLTGEGTGLRHVVEGEIDLADAHDA
jgi:hypothetical protein